VIRNGAGQAHVPLSGEPSFAELEQAAGWLLGKAAQVEAAGPDGRLASEWQAAFAAARAAVSASVDEITELAAFGMRIFTGRGAVIEAQTPAQRARSRILAAAVVSLQASGRAGAAVALASLVTAMSGDETLPLLLPFCVCLEALVRCRLAVDAAEDGAQSPAAFWRQALAAARAQAGPALVLCGGLSGSGKSFVAEGIGCAVGARVSSSDPMRKRLAGIAPTERTPPDRRADVYGSALNERVYAALVEEAEAELRAGWPVVLDATFLTRSGRQPALSLARQLLAPAAILWCVLDNAQAEARLRQRVARGWNVSDGDFAIRAQQRSRLQQPVGRESNAAVISVDTGRAPGALFDALLPALKRSLGGATTND
jgi:predicted kinase